jgi:hypothetical protein
VTTKELRELLARATRGKWIADLDDFGNGEIEACVTDAGVSFLFTSTTDVAYEKDYGVRDWVKARDSQAMHNAALIVAAVNALPALLDRLEKLEEGLRRIRDWSCESEPLSIGEAHDIAAAALGDTDAK